MRNIAIYIFGTTDGTGGLSHHRRQPMNNLEPEAAQEAIRPTPKPKPEPRYDSNNEPDANMYRFPLPQCIAMSPDVYITPPNLLPGHWSDRGPQTHQHQVGLRECHQEPARRQRHGPEQHHHNPTHNEQMRRTNHMTSTTDSNHATADSIDNDNTSTLPSSIYINPPDYQGFGFGFPTLPQPKPEKLKDESAKYERQFREAIEPHIQESARKERHKRIEQRRDYAHLIPLPKRYSYLPLHEELKYQLLARFEQMTPQERAELCNSPLMAESAGETMATFTTQEPAPKPKPSTDLLQ